MTKLSEGQQKDQRIQPRTVLTQGIGAVNTEYSMLSNPWAGTDGACNGCRRQVDKNTHPSEGTYTSDMKLIMRGLNIRLILVWRKKQEH